VQHSAQYPDNKDLENLIIEQQLGNSTLSSMLEYSVQHKSPKYFNERLKRNNKYANGHFDLGRK